MKYIKQEKLLPDNQRNYATVVARVALLSGARFSLEFEPSHLGESVDKSQTTKAWEEQFYELPYIIQTNRHMMKVTEENFVSVSFDYYNSKN